MGNVLILPHSEWFGSDKDKVGLSFAGPIAERKLQQIVDNVLIHIRYPILRYPVSRTVIVHIYRM